MSRNRRWVAAALIAICLGFSGCQSLSGPGEAAPSQAVTPAPVPTTETPTPTQPSNGRSLSGVWPGQWSEFERRSTATTYRNARPTCKRPPAVVVRLQLGALLSGDGPHGGIATTWRFLAPETRRDFDSVEAYAERFQAEYRPLLNAKSIELRPLRRTEGVAVQPLRVHTEGSTTTYNWRVERQSTLSGRACWFTTEITG